MDEIDRLKQFINRKKFTVDVLGELNRLLEGDYNADIIEAILGELVEIASDGQEECAVQAQKKIGYYQWRVDLYREESK